MRYASILLCLLVSLRILYLTSNPDRLVAPVMDLLFIIIAVTTSNLRDLFKEKSHFTELRANPGISLWQGRKSQRNFLTDFLL